MPALRKVDFLLSMGYLATHPTHIDFLGVYDVQSSLLFCTLPLFASSQNSVAVLHSALEVVAPSCFIGFPMFDQLVALLLVAELALLI